MERLYKDEKDPLVVRALDLFAKCSLAESCGKILENKDLYLSMLASGLESLSAYGGALGEGAVLIGEEAIASPRSSNCSYWNRRSGRNVFS